LFEGASAPSNSLNSQKSQAARPPLTAPQHLNSKVANKRGRRAAGCIRLANIWILVWSTEPACPARAHISIKSMLEAQICWMQEGRSAANTRKGRRWVRGRTAGAAPCAAKHGAQQTWCTQPWKILLHWLQSCPPPAPQPNLCWRCALIHCMRSTLRTAVPHTGTGGGDCGS